MTTREDSPMTDIENVISFVRKGQDAQRGRVDGELFHAPGAIRQFAFAAGEHGPSRLSSTAFTK